MIIYQKSLLSLKIYLNILSTARARHTRSIAPHYAHVQRIRYRSTSHTQHSTPGSRVTVRVRVNLAHHGGGTWGIPIWCLPSGSARRTWRVGVAELSAGAASLISRRNSQSLKARCSCERGGIATCAWCSETRRRRISRVLYARHEAHALPRCPKCHPQDGQGFTARDPVALSSKRATCVPQTFTDTVRALPALHHS